MQEYQQALRKLRHALNYVFDLEFCVNGKLPEDFASPRAKAAADAFKIIIKAHDELLQEGM